MSWLNKKNELFTRIGGELFTNREVVLVHVIVLSMIVGGIVAEKNIAVSLLCVAMAVVGAILLNRNPTHYDYL